LLAAREDRAVVVGRQIDERIGEQRLCIEDPDRTALLDHEQPQIRRW